MKNKLIDGNTKTVTGLTLGENLERWVHKHGELSMTDQNIIKPLDQPIKSTGHIRILRGNIAPGGAVSKITGKEGLRFTGKAKCFHSEDELVKAVEDGTIKKGEKTVIVMQYLGPKGGPGTLTRTIIALVGNAKETDSRVLFDRNARDVEADEFGYGCRTWPGCSVYHGRAVQWRVSYSFACTLLHVLACCLCGHRRPHSPSSHGFVVGHVVPEAQIGGPIALIQDGDIIRIDAVANTLDMEVTEEELDRRRKAWKAPLLKVSQGTLYKYTKVVADASHGCITDG